MQAGPGAGPMPGHSPGRQRPAEPSACGHPDDDPSEDDAGEHEGFGGGGHLVYPIRLSGSIGAEAGKLSPGLRFQPLWSVKDAAGTLRHGSPARRR